jgi:hypothetical protein
MHECGFKVTGCINRWAGPGQVQEQQSDAERIVPPGVVLFAAPDDAADGGKG